MGIKHLIITLVSALASVPAVAFDVSTVTVERVRAAEGFEIDGTLAAVHQVVVAAQVGGNVTQLAVKAGDRVKAGQLIARIDERDAAAALQRSDAALTQAQAEAGSARASVERTRRLRADGFVSQAALDNAESQWKAAQAAVQQAQALRSQATLTRGFASVAAPFDGVVLATHLDAGDLASPGRPIATVYAPDALRAVVQLGVSRAEAARAAERIEIILGGGQRIRPARTTELATADPVAQTIEWRLDLPASAADGLAPGQTVRVRFSGGAAPAGAGPLRVPAAAVLRRGELTAVYLIQDDAFVLRAIRVGADRGPAGVDVMAGLRPGDRIAADALKAGLTGARPAAPSRAPVH